VGTTSILDTDLFLCLVHYWHGDGFDDLKSVGDLNRRCTLAVRKNRARNKVFGISK
jgi:hypothetical protein